MASFKPMYLPKFLSEVAKAKMFGETDASRYVSSVLAKVLNRTIDVGGGKYILAFQDPAEDVDDPDAIMRYFTTYASHTVHVFLSGGYYECQQRLDFLEDLFPFLKGVQFGVPIANVTFFADGAPLPDIAYDIFLHCAPASTATFSSAIDHVKPGGRVVLVGGRTYANAINQRYTDKGMTGNKEQWDADISKFQGKGCVVISLDADVSRNVRFPNPATLPVEHPFSSASLEAISPKLHALYFNVALRFLVSRPPFKRINESNSRVFAATLAELLETVTESDFEEFIKFEAQCRELGVPEEATDSASICFALSSRLGVKYVPGVYSIDPKDHAGRASISCISNADEVMVNYKAAARSLIPAYDTVAAPLAFESDEMLAMHGLI